MTGATMDQGPILIGFDGSPPAREATIQAARLFAQAPAVIATVWETVEEIAPAGAIGAPAGVVGEAARRLDSAAQRQADRLAEDGAELARGAGLAADPRSVRSAGSVWSTICRLAGELDARAIVVGSRGRSGMGAAVLGSVSSSVLQHGGRPTLVVRAP